MVRRPLGPELEEWQMAKKTEVRFGQGTDLNFSGKPAKGKFTLHGDPKVKVEKALTIIHFPGGSFELSRTSDGDYWAHIALDHPGHMGIDEPYNARVVDARLDLKEGYVSDALDAELRGANFQHVAVRISNRPEVDKESGS